VAIGVFSDKSRTNEFLFYREIFQQRGTEYILLKHKWSGNDKVITIAMVSLFMKDRSLVGQVTTDHFVMVVGHQVMEIGFRRRAQGKNQQE
jgi:hypothetical protein